MGQSHFVVTEIKPKLAPLNAHCARRYRVHNKCINVIIILWGKNCASTSIGVCVCVCVCVRLFWEGKKEILRIQYSKMDDEVKTKRFRASAAVMSTSACGGYMYRRNSSPPTPQPTSVLTGISTSHGARSRPVVAAVPVADASDGNYTYMAILIHIYIYTYITCVGPSVNFGGSHSDSLGNIIYICILQ